MSITHTMQLVHITCYIRFDLIFLVYLTGDLKFYLTTKRMRTKLSTKRETS